MLLLFAALAACGGSAPVVSPPIPTISASSPTPPPSPTASLPNTPVPTQSIAPTLTETPYYFPPAPVPDATTVILASRWGDIMGGYSHGRWLTHEEAASYCTQDMVFYEYAASGKSGARVESRGISIFYNSGLYCYSLTAENEYSENIFYLLIDEPPYGYAKYELVTPYLVNVPPKTPSEIKVLDDVTGYLPSVQDILDRKFGKGKVIAQIPVAYEVSVGKGKKLIIVNAFNNSGMHKSDKEYEQDNWVQRCMPFRR